jgi:phage terminase small subunit
MPGASRFWVGLTSKQRRFAQEYLKDQNGTQAAIRAGYSANGASQAASHLLGLIKIQDAIRDGLSDAMDAAQVEAEDVYRVLASCLMFDPASIIGEDGEVMPMGEWPEEARMACTGIDVHEEFGRSPDGERVKLGQVTKLRWVKRTEAADYLSRILGTYGRDPEGGAEPLNIILHLADDTPPSE